MCCCCDISTCEFVWLHFTQVHTYTADVKVGEETRLGGESMLSEVKTMPAVRFCW